jgi:hypothetical protein
MIVGFIDELKDGLQKGRIRSGDQQAKLMGSVYGDDVCCVGVSRVVCTTELHGTTGCHGS